jgi:hypothetical protein
MQLKMRLMINYNKTKYIETGKATTEKYMRVNNRYTYRES